MSNKNFTQALFDVHTSAKIMAMSKPASEVIDAIHTVVPNVTIPRALYLQERSGESIRDGYFTLDGGISMSQIERLKKKNIAVDTVSPHAATQINVYFKVM